MLTRLSLSDSPGSHEQFGGALPFGEKTGVELNTCDQRGIEAVFGEK